MTRFTDIGNVDAVNTIQRLRNALARLSPAQLRDLCERADVPIHTAYKIKSGETTDPRISTVDRLDAALGAATEATP